MKTSRDVQDVNRGSRPKRGGPCASSECGAIHGDCPNAWKGSCDHEAGHSGSHHCDKCQSYF